MQEKENAAYDKNILQYEKMNIAIKIHAG